MRVVIVEDINCQACNGTGYAFGHGPTVPGVPYRWCSTCQGVRIRHRAVSLEEFARLLKQHSCAHNVSIDSLPPFCGQCGAEDPWSK